MKRHDQSFSARLSLNILLLTSILFLAAIVVAAISSHKLIADEATRSAQALLGGAVSDIEKTLSGVEATVNGTAWMVAEHLDDPEYMYRITDNIVKSNPDIVGSAVAFAESYYPGRYFFSPYSFLNEDGELHSKQLGTEQNNYFQLEWYEVPAESGEACWSEPYFDEGGAQILMSTYSLPLKDESGKVYAVMTADIPISWISEILSNIKPYKSSAVSLVSRNGLFVSIGPLEEYAGKNLYSLVDKSGSSSGIRELADAIMSGESGVRRFSQGAKISFAVFGPLSNGWHAYMTCDYKEVLARTSEMHMVLILIGLLGLLVLFVVSYLTIRHLTRPLAEISSSALSIAQGNFNTCLPELRYDDEISKLRDSFEVMQKSLTDYISDLKATTAANERFESELNIANAIQMAMLPRNFPHNEMVDLHATLLPAREVGGDLYDFIIKDNILYFTVGDVSGKGVPASMFMAITRSAIRFILGLGLPLDEVVYKVNDAFCDGNDTGMFVTLFLGSINLETGEFRYCNAGHNPIVVNGAFLPAVPNLAVGIMPGFKYKEQITRLEKGAELVIYTDGVTEAERSDNSQYGEERLLRWAAAHIGHGSACDTCNTLVDDVHAFTDGNNQNDDITVMTIKIK
ncbi:MAG: SpoIIE family protein phosphatase [Bacteroidales bacterium]|nr:SpoIIE family protein phosphatase [Candidatus Equibacterium intestinale]